MSEKTDLKCSIYGATNHPIVLGEENVFLQPNNNEQSHKVPVIMNQNHYHYQHSTLTLEASKNTSVLQLLKSKSNHLL